VGQRLLLRGATRRWCDVAFEETFQRVAEERKLDWRLMVEQCYRESQFDPLAIGADNNMGLMQIVPATWDDWAPKVGVYDPFDPDSNIAVAGAYLAWLRDQLAKVNRPEPYWLLAAYDWGIANVLKLLKTGGAWQDVPEDRRDYATGIILAAEASALAEQIKPGSAPVYG
jgi:membrane-bound lytic murein transglycosylase MltF